MIDEAVGFDAEIKGRKLFAVMDTLGLVLLLCQEVNEG